MKVPRVQWAKPKIEGPRAVYPPCEGEPGDPFRCSFTGRVVYEGRHICQRHAARFALRDLIAANETPVSTSASGTSAHTNVSTKGE